MIRECCTTVRQCDTEQCHYCHRWLPHHYVHWNGDHYWCRACSALERAGSEAWDRLPDLGLHPQPGLMGPPARLVEDATDVAENLIGHLAEIATARLADYGQPTEPPF